MAKSYDKDMRKTFRESLLAHMEEAGESLAEVARATGVSYEQIKKVKQRGGSTNIEDALKIANHFGLSLDEFLGDETQAIRSEIVDLYNALSAEEQDHLLAAARAFAAAHDKNK